MPESQEKTSLADFRRRIAPFADTWTSLDVRFSAVRQGDTWSNLFTRAQFGWDTISRPGQRLVVDSKLFRAGQLRVPITEVPQWLEGLAGRELRFRGFQVRLGHINLRLGTATSDQVTWYGWNVWKLDREGGIHTVLGRDPEWEHGVALGGSGDQAYSLLPPDQWGEVNDLSCRMVRSPGRESR